MKIITNLLFLSMAATSATAQSIAPATLNAAGGTASISGNIYDWSVSEMTMVNTFTSSSVIVTQGLLQPEMMPSGIAATELSQKLEVFPNPANSVVNIRLNADAEGRLCYRLLDMTGKIIISQSADVKPGLTTKQLDITRLAAATYMLDISFTGKNDKSSNTSYKIEKLN